jgi:hypothetical protein
MKLYVRVMFNSEGASPIALIRVMSELGFQPVMGEFDFFYEFADKPTHYRETLRTLHERLRGLKVMYQITTKKS